MKRADPVWKARARKRPGNEPKSKDERSIEASIDSRGGGKYRSSFTEIFTHSFFFAYFTRHLMKRMKGHTCEGCTISDAVLLAEDVNNIRSSSFIFLKGDYYMFITVILALPAIIFSLIIVWTVFSVIISFVARKYWNILSSITIFSFLQNPRSARRCNRF